MSKALVDTTILVNALLKPGAQSKAALAALNKFTETSLPVYAIKEFREGPLYYYVWLYNKLVSTNSYPKTLSAIAGMFRRKNLQATAYGAIEIAQGISNTDLASLTLKYGPTASLEDVLRDELKLIIKGLIIKAWRKRRTLTDKIVHDLPCFAEIDPIIKGDGTIDLLPLGCTKRAACCVAKHLKTKEADLDLMQAALEPHEGKAENLKRRTALNALIKLKVKEIDQINDKQCKAFGDAVFSFYCEADQSVLTTNDVDHKILADSLKKNVSSY